MVSSCDPLTMRRPAVERHTLFTVLVCPVRQSSSAPLPASPSRTVPSFEACCDVALILATALAGDPNCLGRPNGLLEGAGRSVPIEPLKIGLPLRPGSGQVLRERPRQSLGCGRLR